MCRRGSTLHEMKACKAQYKEASRTFTKVKDAEFRKVFRMKMETRPIPRRVKLSVSANRHHPGVIPYHARTRNHQRINMKRLARLGTPRCPGGALTPVTNPANRDIPRVTQRLGPRLSPWGIIP